MDVQLTPTEVSIIVCFKNLGHMLLFIVVHRFVWIFNVASQTGIYLLQPDFISDSSLRKTNKLRLIVYIYLQMYSFCDRAALTHLV